MATIKSYSVARTQRSYDPDTATPDSDVYALSQGRQGAYDHATTEGMTEGRVPTLVDGARTATNPVASAVITTAGAAGPVSETVICTTTTETSATEGAGLIVSFTTSAAGAIAGTITIVDGGESYATGNVVSVDGFAGSELTVTV